MAIILDVPTIKYVESTAGSKFCVRTSLAGMELRDLEAGDCVVVDYLLDGKKVDSIVKRFPLDRHPSFDLRRVRYRENGSWKQRDFMFAELITTEDVSSSKPRPELKDLGTITAEFRVGISEKRKHREKSYHDSTNKPTVGHGNIHEKHLKGQAISQQANLESQHTCLIADPDRLGDSSRIPKLSSVRVEYLNDGEPFATFQFRYRSRRDLQILCLIPRSPSPVPLENRPEESLSREELLELLRRQKALREEQITIKRELKRERVDDDESDDEPSSYLLDHPPQS
ncbi:hypothetical protein E4T43_06741 [Aureobasidium subglaciale]|nr:hypothetical protein E4T43_06741 [Aureobasidium subglaciale]